jgi:hypothetical protein
MEHDTISLAERQKLEKNLGNVYAIFTSKGYALGQVADIEDRNGIYLCRIFNKLYKVIPENIAEIITGKEDYIVQIMMPGMAHPRVKMAQKLGKYEIPHHYKRPEYVKCCIAFGVDDIDAPMKYWHIVPNYLPVGELISRDEWVVRVLGRNIYDRRWKDDFKKLNPLFIMNGKSLIEKLESGWNLKNWLPFDFHKGLKYLWKEYYKDGSTPYKV